MGRVARMYVGTHGPCVRPDSLAYFAFNQLEWTHESYVPACPFRQYYATKWAISSYNWGDVRLQNGLEQIVKTKGQARLLLYLTCR